MQFPLLTFRTLRKNDLTYALFITLGDRFNMVIWMENKTQATVDIKFCCGNEEETYQLQHGRKARLRKQVEQSSVRISATTLSGDELLINGETSVQVAVAIDYDTLYIVSDQGKDISSALISATIFSFPECSRWMPNCWNLVTCGLHDLVTRGLQ